MRKPFHTPTYHDTADFLLARAKRAKHPEQKQRLLFAAMKYRAMANEQDIKRKAAPDVQGAPAR